MAPRQVATLWGFAGTVLEMSGCWKKKTWVWLLVVAVGLALLATGGYYRYWRYHLKRFDVVRAGVLYRSGQPSRRGLEYLVRHCGVRTVLCVLPEDPMLKEGLFVDWGRPRRVSESAETAKLGARFLLWPVSEKQVYWPWPQPDQFDALFELFDEPENLPVEVHCLQGRHRTGTCVALFRLEYDRWDIERVLAEMYSFDFGPPVRLQEHHLRTYYRRPRPDAEQWSRLRKTFGPLVPGKEPGSYEELVRQLRKPGDGDERLDAVAEWLDADEPFAVCLASRLMGRGSERLTAAAIGRAERCLRSPESTFDDVAVSAALVADCGSPIQRAEVLALLEREREKDGPTALYEALVAGLTNRYRRSRIAYLRPLLSDSRSRPEAQAKMYRYCDTAAARLATIVNEPLFDGKAGEPERVVWDRAVERARRWLEEHAGVVEVGVGTGRK